jgi:hypothetical protein
MKEIIIRVLALLLGCALVFCYYLQTENGHYQIYFSSGGNPIMLDTRTGDLYRGDSGKWVTAYALK